MPTQLLERVRLGGLMIDDVSHSHCQTESYPLRAAIRLQKNEWVDSCTLETVSGNSQTRGKSARVRVALYCNMLEFISTGISRVQQILRSKEWLHSGEVVSCLWFLYACRDTKAQCQFGSTGRPSLDVHTSSHLVVWAVQRRKSYSLAEI